MELSDLFPVGSELIKPPVYEGDAGFGIVMPKTVWMFGFIRVISTPIRVNGQVGTFGFIVPRSSALKRCIITLGIVDYGYRGKLNLITISLNPFRKLEKGKSYFQLIFVYFLNPLSKQSTLTRDEGGLGSTGDI